MHLIFAHLSLKQVLIKLYGKNIIISIKSILRIKKFVTSELFHSIQRLILICLVYKKICDFRTFYVIDILTVNIILRLHYDTVVNCKCAKNTDTKCQAVVSRA